ncbi:hypothetical protein EW026_g5142 [Hermanssonia centrifuga]|uniref:Uncharacterized protein n=1 Tax=Hermanssonia centrifuga TaxID=98765 RepID=A0A4S4KFF2_9APHY|nr:hypothetical protein EW026_g5142 [Hermanssonia centrifuga]
MMFKSALFVAALAVSAVSGNEIVRRAESLVARQGEVIIPGLSSNESATCSSECTGPLQTWQTAVTQGQTNATAALMTICTDTFVSQLAECFDCVAPVAQQEGNTTFVSATQADFDALTNNCDLAGLNVSSVTIKASGAPISYSLSGMAMLGVVAAVVALGL